jgi:hypothetical protein
MKSKHLLRAHSTLAVLIYLAPIVGLEVITNASFNKQRSD